MKKYLNWLSLSIWTWFTWYLTGVPNLRITPDSLEQFVISKGGHIFFFGLEAVLAYLALPHNSKFKTLNSIIIASALGAATEIHQSFVAGRHMSVYDWALDTLSALLFVLILRKYSKFGN